MAGAPSQHPDHRKEFRWLNLACARQTFAEKLGSIAPAARTAFFPWISLTSSGGVAGNQLSRLFTGGGLTWSFSPQLNLPVLRAQQML